jgi:hypothetical protein
MTPSSPRRKPTVISNNRSRTSNLGKRKSLKQLCVHAHLSLPPREDPFTHSMLRDASAAPFRNLYEQVAADCYLPNAVLGNFDLMSFDVAPTLLRQLEKQEAAAYSRILAADRGNAIATTFYHIALPVLSRRDKVTLVKWGLRAFQTHYGHPSNGLWLPEMAVDDETLDVLAENGIEFTLLSQEQLRGNPGKGAGPYQVRLKTGRTIAVFARNRMLSDKISFELNWLGGAGMFVARYFASFRDQGLLLIATDGETYGHYHPGEEMFLRYLLQQEASNAGYQLVPLTGYLRDHPPDTETQIVSPSSWSCEHDVERWQRECGCAASAGWKAPLCTALRRLAEAVDTVYEREACEAGLDPWALRNGFADALLDRIPELACLANYETRPITRTAEERVLSLLHAEAHRLAMFNGYAFAETEFGLIEMRNVVAHAACAVSLVAHATGEDLGADLRRDLALATDPRGDRTATEIYTEIVEAQHI